jgi:Nucleolar pre-ribosomal-associated protein 1
LLCWSEFASNASLLTNLKSSSDLLTALDLGIITENANGNVKVKTARSTNRNSTSSAISAHQFILTRSSEGSIDWSVTSPIDAKMVFLSSLKKLLDGQTKLMSATVIRQALENGAKDRSYLRLFLFENTQLLKSIIQNTERLELLVEVITTSTFNSEDEMDRDMMSNLIQLLVHDLTSEKKSTSLCQASARLSSFMRTSERQRIVDILIHEEECLEQVSGILSMDKNTVLYDETLEKIILKQNDKRNVKDLLHLLQRSHKSANIIAEKLIDYTIANLEEPLASMALRSLMTRYEASRPYVVQQLITRPNLILSKNASESIGEAIGVHATNVPSDLADDVIATIVSHVFSKDKAISTAMMRAAVSLKGTLKDQMFTTLLSSIPEKPINVFKVDAVLLALHAAKYDDQYPTAKKVVQMISEKILLWLVRRFAEDDEDSTETLEIIKAFLELIQFQPDLLKSFTHLVEPVLTAAINRRLQYELHAELITSLFLFTPLKSNAVQLYMDKMLHDRAALAIASIRESIVTAVTTYIEKDKSLASNAVMTRLVSLYRGSLELSDRQIFQSLAFYEQSHSSASMLSMFKEWNTSNNISGANDESLIYRLDANRVLDTIQQFPRARSYRDLKSAGYGQLSTKYTDLGSLYDPLFLLSVYAQFLSGDRNPSGLQLVELMRTNFLGATVCCLSSNDQSVRDSASLMVAKTYGFAKSAEFHEKEQLLLILDALRNSIKQAKAMDEDGLMSRPLPLTITMFVAHAIRALAQPTLYLYPLISRFLLQRATPLDPADIPLLYGFLYASSYQTQTYKQQRLFILRFLSSTIRYGGEVDWKIMRHRHVWQGICVLYTASRSTNDTGLKRAIEEFWLSAMQKEHVITYAVLRIGFVDYLQQVIITMGTSNEQEKKYLLHLICCIIQNGDLQKLHKATNNLWLSSLCGLIAHLKIANLTLSSNLADDLSLAVQKLSLFSLEGALVSKGSDLFKTMDLLSNLLMDYVSSIEGVERTFEEENHEIIKNQRNFTPSLQRAKAALKLKSIAEENDGQMDKDLLQNLITKGLYIIL